MYSTYIGLSSVRTIRAADWTSLTIANTGDTVWNVANGYSIDEGSLSAGQIAYLGTQSDFAIHQAAPRAPGGAVDNPGGYATNAAVAALVSGLLPSSLTRMFHVGHSLAAGGGAPSEEQAWHNLVGGMLRAEVVNYARGGAVACWAESNVLPYGQTGDGGVGHVLSKMPLPALYRPYKGAYAGGTTYAAGDIVVTGAAPFSWWVSQIDVNTGNNPVGDAGTHWQALDATTDQGHPYEARGQLPFVFFGNNDLGWVGDLNGWLNSMRSILSMVLASEVSVRATDARCSYSGAFQAASTLGAGCGIAAAVTNGARGVQASLADIETIAIPADWPGGYVGLTYVIAGKSNGGVFRVQVDGATVLTKDISVDTVGVATAGKTSNFALRFQVPAGAHTITVQQTTVVAGMTLLFTDGLILEANPAPPVVVPGLFKFLAGASYAALYGGGTAASDATVDAWNTALKAMLVAEFPSAYYHDLPITKSAPTFASDGVHQNAKGHAIIAADMTSTLINTVLPGVTTEQRAGLSRLSKAGRLVKLNFGDDFPTGAISVTVAGGWTDLGYIPSKAGFTNAANALRYVEASISADPGDVIELSLLGLAANNAGATSYLDFAVLGFPNGRSQTPTRVSYVSSGTSVQATYGLNGGAMGNAAVNAPLLPASAYYKVKATDLSLGQITFRAILQAIGATRGVYVSVDNRIHLAAKNIGQEQPYMGELAAR